MRSFIDTNLLIYTDDSAFPEKQRRALDLVAELRLSGDGVLSIQVLQEYFAVATRKLGVEAAVARRRMELFAKFDVVIPSVELLTAAADLHRLRSLSWWDALIVQAAVSAGCAVLLSEDMQHGETVAGVRIVNPFRPEDGNG